MPKKRVPTYNTKPSSPAHPSLSSSGKPKDVSHSLGSGQPTASSSVNERLQQLRKIQGSQKGRVSTDVFSAAASPSLPPPLRNILQIPDAPPPRPRPGLRVAGRMRGPAGPVPPSWLARTDQGSNKQTETRLNRRESEITRCERLPDSAPLSAGSLRTTTLKAIAKNWDWHIQYDQYYLSTIPVPCKDELVHYVRCYSSLGIDKSGLDVLFLDNTELEDATGAEGLTHLDLTMSIGNSLNLTELRSLFNVKKTVAAAEEEYDALPESWDSPKLEAEPSGLPRFHSLTHLSLSRPNPTAASWKGLLDLALYLATLTHLSLAYWPTPTLSPNSRTAYREMPQGNINYGASNFYSEYDNDWSEAASILRRLGKSIHCLKWLDLTGCHSWVKALGLLDWIGSWQALETVKIGQGWIPECFEEDPDERAWRSIIYKIPLSPPEDVRMQKKHRLCAWARTESETLALEGNINARITLAFMKQAFPRHGDAPWALESRTVGCDAWDDESPERTGVKYRSNRVIFDRGWNAWWIRKAVEEICLTG